MGKLVTIGIVSFSVSEKFYYQRGIVMKFKFCGVLAFLFAFINVFAVESVDSSLIGHYKLDGNAQDSLLMATMDEFAVQLPLPKVLMGVL